MSETKRATPPRVLARILNKGQKLEAAIDALPMSPMVRGLPNEARSWLIKKAVEDILRYDAICRDLLSLRSFTRVPKAKAQNQSISLSVRRSG